MNSKLFMCKKIEKIRLKLLKIDKNGSSPFLVGIEIRNKDGYSKIR